MMKKRGNATREKRSILRECSLYLLLNIRSQNPFLVSPCCPTSGGNAV